ncbi:MAG TPA: hypothetical protein VFJ30_14285 [Phycisphaerae bacterium]|nr:hypothetical protein [Phycisphaerae bacterium]
MTERERDEQLLIDYALGQCDAQEGEGVRRRLECEESFAALHNDISNALAALGTWSAPDPPEDLVDRTLDRIRAMRRTEALVQAQPIQRRAWTPTFSLRELGAVAAVLLLALGVLLPALYKARDGAHRVLCADNISAIWTGLNHYASANNEALPVPPHPTRVWLGDPGRTHASNTAALFRLVRDNYSPPSVFQCPAARCATFVVRQGLVDFPSPRNLAYTYQHCLAGPIRRDLPELVNVAQQYAIVSERHPVFVDGTFRRDRIGRDVSDNHGGTGQNVLYLDGSVQWTASGHVGVNGNNIWLVEGVYDYRGDEEPASTVDTFLLP